MARVGIVTDSTAYLDEEYVRTHDIKVVPLKVILDGVSYREGVDITHQEFYRRLRNPGVFPTTSQPSVGEFLEAYREMAERYEAIISIHISGGISGTVESARSAASEIPDFPIRVVDSLTTSILLRRIIDGLVEAREKGADLDEMVRLAESAARSGNLMFVVDTLEYLHRGGRIGGAQALLGSMLRIKPILFLHDTIDALDKVRGERKALDRLVEILLEKVAGREVRLGVTHVQAEDRMRELLEKVSQATGVPASEIPHNETGPVIGAHVGPGTVGVGFYAVDRA
ncbi:MAG: DegV family protein [Candidatus Geothermincolales bacterium]